MGTRGPKKGFKLARQEGAEKPLSSIKAQKPAKQIESAVELSAADRENPERLSGDMLRALAHRRGLSLSALSDMSDEKIRVELRYVTHRQYEELEAA